MTCKEIFLEEMGRLFDAMWEYFDEDVLNGLEVFDEVKKKLEQNQMACDPSLTPEENFKNGIRFTAEKFLFILERSSTKARWSNIGKSLKKS